MPITNDVKQFVGEPIRVLASFAEQRATIHFFNWNDRIYKVDSFNLFHLEKEGNRRLYHFAVSAEGNSYELIFEPSTLQWKLGEVVSL